MQGSGKVAAYPEAAGLADHGGDQESLLRPPWGAMGALRGCLARLKRANRHSQALALRLRPSLNARPRCGLPDGPRCLLPTRSEVSARDRVPRRSSPAPRSARSRPRLLPQTLLLGAWGREGRSSRGGRLDRCPTKLHQPSDGSRPAIARELPSLGAGPPSRQGVCAGAPRSAPGRRAGPRPCRGTALRCMRPPDCDGPD